MNEIEIKIDYVSLTFPLPIDQNDSILFIVQEMVRLFANFLNVKNFEIQKVKYAQNNYKYQFQLGEFITLRLDGPLNDCYQRTCHLEMKGEGCRDFERRNPNKSWINFFLFMAELNSRFKRIDLAVDDFTGKDVTMPWILEKLKKKLYTSVFRSSPDVFSSIDSGFTIQLGGTKSPIQLVIYDKRLERKKRKKPCDKDYWVRFEMRFRNEKATALVLALSKASIKNKSGEYEVDMQKFAFEQLYRILDIKENTNFDQDNIHKANTDKRWLTFLQNVQKGSLAKVENNFEKTIQDYLTIAGPYAYTLLMLMYMTVMKDTYIFEVEVYKFLRDFKSLSKKRFQRLNMFLDQMNVRTIDDAELAACKAEFAGIVSERELPF